MKKVNVAKIMENGAHENIANILGQLDNETLLYAMGVIELPKVGDTVTIIDEKKQGVVVSVDYINTTVRVKYDKTVIKYYNKEHTNWSWRSYDEYTERTEIIEEGTEGRFGLGDIDY